MLARLIPDFKTYLVVIGELSFKKKNLSDLFGRTFKFFFLQCEDENRAKELVKVKQLVTV